MIDHDPIPRGTVWFVRGFLGLFFVCALSGVELWPFTGFRLFSTLRTEGQTLWQAGVVGASGRETPVVFNDLPRAYQGYQLIMSGFAKFPPGQKAATCAAWLEELRRRDLSASSLRMYRASWQALPRAGSRPANVARTLVYACS